MKIAPGNDPAGYPMKKGVHAVRQSLGVKVIDYGCFNPEPVDFSGGRQRS
jgi:ribose 5-phosphate isomerase RpiB